MSFQFAVENSFARLPNRFYARIGPIPVAAPRLIRVNQRLARQLGLDPDWLASAEGVEILAGKRVPAGAEPIAAAYADTSSDTSCHSSATDAPSSSAKSSTGTGFAGTSS